ncbi:cytochrome P450 71D11-like [Mangifera indica]|uniref:cytochrome P450 71D11-like n=1 Tax=Mangifera indica TaxID=29780 RepID=UPI001CFBF81E|nr:cytochrome P450 71D11-like [Mangifera indica]
MNELLTGSVVIAGDGDDGISLESGKAAQAMAHIYHCLSRLATLKWNFLVMISSNCCRTGVQFIHSVLSLARGLLRLDVLSSDIVAASAFNREEEVSALIHWLASNAGPPINLTEKIFTLIYGITSRAAFGSKSKDQELFISVMEDTVKVTAGFSIADLFPSIGFLQRITGFKFLVQKLHQEADRIVEKILNDHKVRNDKSGEAEDDLVDVLLKVQEHGDLEFPLPIDNIKAVVSDIFCAGGDNVQDDEKYKSATTRHNLRDPEYWNEPQIFNPERFLNHSLYYKGTGFEYIPFGAGRRICPGISFGLANVELPLAMFLYHFDWKLSSGMKNADLDMAEAFGITVGRKEKLHIIPIPYHPPASS